MTDRTIIDLDEIRRVRKKAAESIEAQEEDSTAPVRLVVRGKNQIEFSIDGNTYLLTEDVARSWIDFIYKAVYQSRAMGEPQCETCGRHACRLVHPGQEWKRKTDGKMVTVKTVFGARIQLEQESGRVTTVTGQHRLQHRYRGPWEWRDGSPY